MTVLSQVNAQEFSSQAKVVFPDGVFFNPLDYLKPFNEHRHSVGLAELGEHTFKKYLSIVCDTPYFPELLRDRNDSKSPYSYCIDRSSEKDENPPSLVETAKREGGRKSFAAARGPLSRSALVRLGNLVVPLMKPGHNKVSTLRNRYLRAGHRSLTKQTFSYYMSVLCRKDIVPGLSRQRGPGGIFQYCLAGAGNTVSRTPRQDSKEFWKRSKKEQSGCSSCHSPNPRKAKFCMECGSALGVRVKAILQERVLSIPFASPMDVDSTAVKKWVSAHLEVSLKSEGGVFSAIVDIKGDDHG